jgi:enamine deaminase RidA (YjgF/YER057c/UK114 family)
MHIIQPPNWVPPRGYANGVAARGTLVFVGGQVGWDPKRPDTTGRPSWPAMDFAGQTRQALQNIAEVLAAAGSAPEQLVRLNWYVLDRDEYVAAWPAIGKIYREIIGKHYPAMAAFGIGQLVEPEARVEIEATAVIPDK